MHRGRTYRLSLALLVALVIATLAAPGRLDAQAPRGDQPLQDTPKLPFDVFRSEPAPDNIKQTLAAASVPAAPEAPSNDDFGAAISVGSFPYSHSIYTSSATAAADDPYMTCTDVRNSNTVWYRLTLPAGGFVVVDTLGSNYDTVLAVFTGSRGHLNIVSCSDDVNGTAQSGTTFLADAGVTYYIEVADYGTPGGGLLQFHVDTVYQIVPLENSYVRANVASGNRYSGYAGRFVIGTTGGDPTSAVDDSKRMLYGYPTYIGSSFATVRVVEGSTTRDYRLGAEALPSSGPRSGNDGILTTWQLNGAQAEQRLYLATNPDSGRPDTVGMEYRLTNNTSSARQVGLRVMLDTMIGDNDGAPLFAPGAGRITTEREFTDSGVPDYWVSWESPTFDPAFMKAKQLLRGAGLTPPDRLVIAHWGSALCPDAGSGLYNSPWDYRVNASTSITCDSAVALYYNPITLRPGESRTIRTLYGPVPTGNAVDLAADVHALTEASRSTMTTIGQNSRDVAEVGDYFNDKLVPDAASGVLSVVFDVLDLKGAKPNWNQVGAGLEKMSQPGYKSALRASWKGWTIGSEAAAHWSKPIYDALHNGRALSRELLFKQMAWAGVQYYGKDVATGPAKDWLLEQLIPGTGNYVNLVGNRANSLASSYRTELEREEGETVSLLALKSLTEDQLQAYREDMAGRSEANAAIAELLTMHRDLMWESYQDRKAYDANWLVIWGPTLFKWVVVGGCTLAWDGPGFYVSNLATTGIVTLYDVGKTAQTLSQDQQMDDQAFRYLMGRSSRAFSDVALNTVDAFNLIRAGDPPQIPAAEVSVGAMHSYGHWRIGFPVPLWWAEEASDLDVQLTNKGNYETTLETVAAYDHTRTLGGTERFLPEGEALDLAGYSGARATATIPLKSKDGIGESPDSKTPVFVLVLGRTDTGLYKLGALAAAWSPTQVERNTATVAALPAGISPEQAAAAPTYPYPLSSTTTQLPGSSHYVLLTQVTNPFTLTIQSNVAQALPAGFVLLDAGGATVAGNQLDWSKTLKPGESVLLRAEVDWQGPVGQTVSVPAALLTLRDPSTGQGDQYAGDAHTLTAPWPIESDVHTAARWRIAETATIPIKLTNILSNQPVDAVVTTQVSHVDGTSLWSDRRTLTIPARGSGEFTLSLLVPRRLGFASVQVDVTVGGETHQEWLQLVELRGIPLYLPAVAR